MTDSMAAKTWMPTTGGVLSIIVGVGDLFGSLGLFFWALWRGLGAEGMRMFHLPATVLAFLSFMGLVLGILAVMGGIVALRCRNWGLALTGAIASALPFNILGILAVVFIGMARKEFAA